jgi:glycine oxidase
LPDVVVVGGGIIGLSTAYYLACEGASVTVLERAAVSSEASGAAAGMLAALSDEGERPPLFTRLCEDSLELYDTLLPVLKETDIDVYHRRTDILHIAVTRREAEETEALYQKRRATAAVRWLDAAEVRRLEPKASPKTVAAMLTPDAQYADPLRLTQAIGAAARRAGATIHENTPVTRFLRRGDRIAGLRTPGGVYEGDTVLLAGGPWTMALAKRLGANIPVRPVRGQMLSLEGPPGGLSHMIWGANAYLIPREDGQTYVGATVEEAGYRKHTTAAGLRSLRAGAAAVVPALADAKERRSWAGLRPGTPDDMPIMGRLPGWSNAWVSTGHFRNGILLAAVSGQLMAKSMIAGQADALLQELSPTRFE